MIGGESKGKAGEPPGPVAEVSTAAPADRVRTWCEGLGLRVVGGSRATPPSRAADTASSSHPTAPGIGEDRRRIVLTAVFIAYVLFLFDIALRRFPTPDPRPNFVPFRSIVHDLRAGGRDLVINLVGNLVAFLPMGLVPPLILRRRITPRQVALFSLALSLMIEIPQFLSGRRVADVDDLILNTAGGLLGHAMAVLVRGRDRSHASR